PVLIDLPKDITSGPYLKASHETLDLPGYVIPSIENLSDIAQIATLINNCKRPVILAGHGVLISGAELELEKLSDKIKAAVTTTLLGKGSCPETDPMALGMLGMYGTSYANKAGMNRDLIISIGSRWDDRIV